MNDYFFEGDTTADYMAEAYGATWRDAAKFGAEDSIIQMIEAGDITETEGRAMLAELE